ncbi:MAG: hypothetical protein LBB30_05300 [Candidatus Methanoplasma sp.]|jgi:hypothetical protein|nr:hypothetical protein [Candidatus Methanoplasma sp.]
MAKKKRRIVEEKEEEYEFTPAEFDEREFILKDIYGTKVLFVITALAIIVGIVGSLLCVHIEGNGWIAATVLSFVIVLLMKKLLMLMGLRVDLLEMKTMLVNYLLFLMLALGICIILVNAPFV